MKYMICSIEFLNLFHSHNIFRLFHNTYYALIPTWIATYWTRVRFSKVSTYRTVFYCASTRKAALLAREKEQER